MGCWQGAQVEMVEQGLGGSRLGDLDVEIIGDAKTMIVIRMDVAIPECANRIDESACIFGGDTGDRIGNLGQEIIILQDEFQGKIGLGEEDRADCR